MIADEPHDPAAEEENYFVSMSDMMVGMVFIFIILLMYFALQMSSVTDQLSGANKTRSEILKQLEHSLQNKGVQVTVDESNGVLRLPDAILFDSARAEIKPAGVPKIDHLATALSEILPCYTDNRDKAWQRPSNCPKTPHRIESLYIEGHTDSVPLTPTAQFQDNWDLSVKRATNTYRSVIKAAPNLQSLCAPNPKGCEPVLSVSGYADQRPVSPDGKCPGGVANSCNRRIELRIIMVTPDAGQTRAAVQQKLAGQ
jgi:chemotaxis protein MotB